jgi:Na+-driven multidrug efflux pump
MQVHKLDSEEKGILKTTVNMAWPAILESFFVAFAGLVDSYMVSSLGENAVAAVGLTMQPKFLGLALFFALNLAISALVARRFGEQNRRNANEVLVTSLVFLVIAAVVFSVVFVLFAQAIRLHKETK